MTSAPHEITKLLREWDDGDESALERLMPLVYDELHRMAPPHAAGEMWPCFANLSLDYEAYLRLVDSPRIHWQDRAQFFGIAARVMRRTLV